MKRRIAIAVVTLVIVVGAVSLVWIKKMAGGFSARESPSAMETVMARMARKMAIPVDAKNRKNPFVPTAEVLTDARRHFADHCAICHGNDGRGKTEIGRNLYPKVPDMRMSATQHLTDAEIYYVIHNGIRLTGMPAWGGPDKDDDSWKLALFIRHLPHLTPEEVSEMESLNPKGPGAKQEELEDEQFLNESQSDNQAPKPTTHPKHQKEKP